jgi:hypothetical protein
MTPYFRKETDAVDEGSSIAVPPVAETITEHAGPAPAPDNRPLIVPPAVTRPANAAFLTAGATAAAAPAKEEEQVPLFVTNEANELRSKWDSIQVGFVDQPRSAVQEADVLVSATMTRLSEIFSTEREKLERQWEKNENISTEDLRLTLRRYRSFFTRLLNL